MISKKDQKENAILSELLKRQFDTVVWTENYIFDIKNKALYDMRGYHLKKRRITPLELELSKYLLSIVKTRPKA